MKFSQPTPATVATLATQKPVGKTQIQPPALATVATLATQKPVSKECSQSSQCSHTSTDETAKECSQSSQCSHAATAKMGNGDLSPCSQSSQCSHTLSPFWVFEFGDGKAYRVAFDPPITADDALTRWTLDHPDQAVRLSLPIPHPLLTAMHTAAERNGWLECDWPLHIDLIVDALDSGRCSADELTAAYIAPPVEPPPAVDPRENRKREILSVMGIAPYQRKQEPTAAFTLTADPAPERPDSAADLLNRFGYRVIYLRDAELAQKELAAMLNRNPALLGIDIETMSLPQFRLDSKAGLDPHKASIRLVQIADRDTVLVFDLLHLPTAIVAPAMDRPLVAHNAMFESRFLTHAGVNPRLLHCSLLMARVATGKTHGLSLADCSKAVLNIAVDKALQVSGWHNPELSQNQIDYAALDSVLALRLADSYLPVIRSTGQLDAYKRLVRALPVVSRQMLMGVPFDQESHKGILIQWRSELEPLRDTLTRELGINPDSPQQLASWLSKSLDAATLAAWPKTASGQLSTDADTLTTTDHPALSGLRRYKELAKSIGTYGDGYSGHIHPVTGRIHADFGIAGTRGGRFNCRNPNLQNPPRDPAFRRLFKAPEGRVLVVADYSQVELRIAALLALDKTMLDAYQQGADLHIRTAAAVSGIPESEVTKAQRQLAKACNFGLIYGMGAAGLSAYASSSYGVDMPLKAAEKARSAFFTAYPGIATWHTKTKAKSFSDKTVRTRGGLMRDLGSEPHGWKLTEALNTPVQGSGAECLLESLIALPAALAGLDAHLIHHVHDEIVIECACEDADRTKLALVEAMQQGFDTLFPEAVMPGLVEAHSGPDWYSAKG